MQKVMKRRSDAIRGSRGKVAGRNLFDHVAAPNHQTEVQAVGQDDRLERPALGLFSGDQSDSVFKITPAQPKHVDGDRSAQFRPKREAFKTRRRLHWHFRQPGNRPPGGGLAFGHQRQVEFLPFLGARGHGNRVGGLRRRPFDQSAQRRGRAVQLLDAVCQQPDFLIALRREDRCRFFWAALAGDGCRCDRRNFSGWLRCNVQFGAGCSVKV